MLPFRVSLPPPCVQTAFSLAWEESTWRRGDKGDKQTLRELVLVAAEGRATNSRMSTIVRL